MWYILHKYYLSQAILFNIKSMSYANDNLSPILIFLFIPFYPHIPLSFTELTFVSLFILCQTLPFKDTKTKGKNGTKKISSSIQ